jgi:NADPH-dependent F420 reductase
VSNEGTKNRIAVLGGTGPQGRGLAYRYARHAYAVTLWSRTAQRADAAREAEVVVLAVPYDGHDELVASLAAELAGKVVVSCVNPLAFDEHGPFGLPLERSAAESAAALVPSARVVGAFHHVSAKSLLGKAEYLDHEDVLVCGDDAEAKALVIELARAVTGRDGVDAGRLRLARQLEPLTAVLISINKRYRVRSGIAIAGLPSRVVEPVETTESRSS